MPRPCFACKGGLNGRPYCPTCGNTNDSSGFFRNVPLDEQPRTSKEITDAMRGSINLERGVRYRVVIETPKDKLVSARLITFEGVCVWKQGPFAHFDSGHDVNILEIKECEPC